MSEITPERIFQVASGFMASKLFFEASEVGLFEKLAEKPAKLEELAASTGVPSRSVRILADAMVALGFLERKGELYSNTPVAGVFLAGRGPADQRPQLRFWDHISYNAWTNLDQTIRSRKPK